MTFRPDQAWIAILLAMLALPALPALAGGREDPLADTAAAIERGDGVSAEVAARRALALGQPHAAVDAYLGEAAILQSDPDQARKWLASGQFDASSAQRGFHALGRLELDAGHYGPAAKAFDRALQAGKPEARLWVDIGRLRYRSGEQHLAAEAVGSALAIDPDEPQALQFQAELLRDAQGLNAALPWFERAVQLAPQNLDLLGEYAATLGDLGRYRDMLGVARKMVKIDRTDPRAYFLQAVLAAREGQGELGRAARPDASPYLLTLVGRAYEQVNRRDLAAPFLDRAAQAHVPLAPLAPSDGGGSSRSTAGEMPIRRAPMWRCRHCANFLPQTARARRWRTSHSCAGAIPTLPTSRSFLAMPRS